MKFKTTKKAVMNNYGAVISIGYCQLQALLNYEKPIAYTANKYGWRADIYDIDGTAIVTGYAPFGNIEASYELCEKYEKEARKIIYGHNYGHNYSRPDTELKKLIKIFIIAAQAEKEKKYDKKEN